MKINLTIKPETTNDYTAISWIHKKAFGRDNEPKLIEDLRKTSSFDPRLSLIAFSDSQAVGHILFYPLAIETNSRTVDTLGLVPLAVKPSFQKQGIGSQLVIEGLSRTKQLGYKSVFVVGDPNYYSRFGFKLAKNITNNIGEPENHFMFIELEPNCLKDIKGVLRYPPEFSNL